MSPFPKLRGLVAATFTPMTEAGSLNLAAIEKQAAHLLNHEITAAFICGSTGEGLSLSADERRQMTRRWGEVIQGTPLKLIVHVGHNALPEAQALAAEAQRCGAHAISALAPNYFKPATVADLVDTCAAVASAAPAVPFYFYDIPSMTGVHFPMREFLELAAQRIPTLAGLKFTNADHASLQQCLACSRGAFDILYGNDECLLSAWVLGVRGAVGSTYNLIAPVFHRLLAAFERADFAAAQAEQLKAVEFARLCSRFGYLAAAKAAMRFVGVDCGPVRLPLRPLTPAQAAELRQQLDAADLWK
jgi:N-acetylneuraminate lyase